LPDGQAPLPQGAPPAPAPGEEATTPAPPAAPETAQGPLELKMGSSGDMVRDLQRELRKRGIKIKVDGQFGRTTRAGVRIMQRRMNVKATGKADAKFLRRLGIQVRAVASSPSPPAGATTPAVPSGGARYLRVFPVQGKHTYFNDWGAPRGSRSHQGNDIMADKGTPVVAVADGTIHRLTRTPTGLGGIWIWLKDTQGNEYYYAHLDSIAALLEEGSPVAAGQVIGTVGNTGDASYGADHLHFEIHPGGGGAVNPFTELVAVDPNPPTAR
jgi:murein DD-endopeptidase MepM/ murein hydrolase activator NlpD